MNHWRALILAAVSCAASAGGANAASAANATVLTYASPYSPNHTFSRADRTWMRWVQEHSGGALVIRPIWSGALISADESMIELRHGVADIGLITPIYTRGGAHLLRVQTGFYRGAKTFEQQVAMYRCLAAASPQFERELQGLKVLAIQGGTLPGLLTRSREVRRLGDLQGMRVRVPTELLNVMRDLGADPVSMPMGEVYSALAKGVLDGVVAPTDTLKSLHFGEVAKHYTQLEVPRGAYPARAMSRTRWQALTGQERALLDASIPVWEAALSKETLAAVRSGEAEGRAQGVTFIPVAAPEQRRFDELYQRDAQRNARGLARFGIDGMAVFDEAVKVAAGIESTGTVACTEASDAAT
jgi:TRAP-type C4-dicarboxylate transport system substrate-binding protein